MSTPTTIGGLQLWLDAADTSTMFQNTAGTTPVTASGQSVAAWKDKSGNSLNTTSTGYTAPTYSSTGFNSSYPGILFSTGSLLQTAALLPTPTLSANGTDTTVFVVMNRSSPVANNTLFGLSVNNDTYVLRDPWQTMATAILDLGYRIIVTGYGNTGPQLYSLWRSTTSMNFNRFGSLLGTTTVASGSIGTTSQSLGIGGAVAGAASGAYFNSYISEMLIYNVSLSTANRQLVEGYLGWKWGLNTSLPSGHPYRSTNPNAAMPCFARGTRVLTQHGYKAIEMLEHNDYIVTPDRRVIDFKLFKTTVDTTTKHTAPYLIQPHAFGRNVPSAPLRLSATHKIQLAEGLWTSPEKAALTNPLVTQCEIGAPVTYYHIECANYLKDNIVTEGMIVESLGTTKATGGKSDIYAWNSKLNAYTRVGHMDSPKSKSA